MAKRRHTLTIISVIVVAVGLGWLILRSREPVYQGKGLSVWLDQYSTNFWTAPYSESGRQAERAIREIGAGAAPGLLRMISTRESALKTKVLRRLPGSWLARLHLPTAEKYLIELSNHRRVGAHGIITLGPDARSFVPAIVRLLDDRDADVRYVAIFALRGLGPVANTALPALIKCLDDPRSPMCDEAVMCLGLIHEDPDRVVPILQNFIEKNRGDPRLCQDAIQSLGAYGTRAAPAVPLLLPLLDDQDSDTRSRAINALKAIDPEATAKAGLK